MRLFQILSLILMVFALGWLASNLYLYANYGGFQRPFSVGSLLAPSAPELPSPGDHIPERNIHVYHDRVVIDLADATWATYANTNSMDPVFDYGHNGIEVKPRYTDDIHVGDIISYKTDEGLIVHRVIALGNDQQGWYAITKGDNSPVPDEDRVRFRDINAVMVALVY